MSAAPPQVFERAFQNQLSDLGAATEQALDFVRQHGVGGEPAYALHLAIEEMATNILKYGYDDQAAHTIRLRIDPFLQPSRCRGVQCRIARLKENVKNLP